MYFCVLIITVVAYNHKFLRICDIIYLYNAYITGDKIKWGGLVMKEKALKLINKSIKVIGSAEKNKYLSGRNHRNYDYLVIIDDNNLPLCIYTFNEKLIGEKYLDLNSFTTVDENQYIDIYNYENETFLVKSRNTIIGIITIYEINKFLKESLKSLESEYDLVKTDLDAFMACSDDLACISDGEGSKVRISLSCEKIYGVKAESLIGKNVTELEKDGMYFPSATKLVIERKKPVSLTQKTKTGKKLLVNAIPFFDSQMNIKRVVSISKDITDEEKLKKELENTKSIIQKYEKELSSLRVANTQNSELIYRSKVMEKLFETVNKIALVESTVLIYGETGSGKEVLAKYIHNISARAKHPFIKVNCGAIPENLLEAELFGYEKGAFTGARSEGKPGLFEIADQGSLLLDEISELPLSSQVKLLRVLQEKEFMRVGGVSTISANVRIFALSNKDLKDLVKEGKFRQDLYYRLNVIPLTMPPLRERLDDIPILAHHFLEIYNKRYNRSKQMTSEVMKMMMKYPWPGNVRELENVIERMVVVSDENYIDKKDLPEEFFSNGESSNSNGVNVTKLMPLKEASALVEYQLIKQAIELAGNTYKAAEILGVDQSTIVRKLKKYEAAQ